MDALLHAAITAVATARTDAPAAERLPLPGARAALVRPIAAADAVAEQAFVGALSLDARHMRFHIGLRQLSPTMLRRMTEVDQRDHVALVALDAGDGRTIVADARYVRDETRPDEAEFAIAVADDWQSRGLGRTLFARLAEHARRQGLTALYGDVLAENRRMLVLMRGMGAVARPHPDGPQLVRVVYSLEAAG